MLTYHIWVGDECYKVTADRVVIENNWVVFYRTIGICEFLVAAFSGNQKISVHKCEV